MKSKSRFNKQNLIIIAAHVAALLPLAIGIYDGFTGGLTFNPIQEATLRTGRYALTLLLLSLAVTPLNMLFGWRWAIPLRKIFGLYAFGYAALHLLIFVGLDYGLDWGLISEAIFKKRYALVGLAAFLVLLPLALTSTKGAMKQMGKNWKRLHRFVYLASGLVIVHFIWLVKSDLRRPMVYGVALAILLIVRLPAIRRWISEQRSRRRKRQQRKVLA